MSNILRKLKKERKNLGRSGKNSRGRPKGPPAVPRTRPPSLSIPTPEGEPDLTKADPGCCRCHGTGVDSILVQGNNRTRLVCRCVARGMIGDAPWLKKTATVTQ